MARHRADRSATEFDAATSALSDVSGDYSVDPAHTRIGFRARHAMVTTVRGSFTQLQGTAHLDSRDPPASHVEITIAVASIDTGEPGRDTHLRSPDFFDVEAFPSMTFASTEVEQVDDAVYQVTGDLTIKDVTRPVQVDFTLTGSARDPFGNLRVGFEGALMILRSEWGLTWNAALETGGVLISDKVQIEFDVSAVSSGLPGGSDDEANDTGDDASGGGEDEVADTAATSAQQSGPSAGSTP